MVRRALILTSVLTFGLAISGSPARAGGGGCVELTDGSGAAVELLRSCFTPTVLRTEPGTVVTFVNRDPYPHVITGAGYAWGSESSMRSDEAFSVRFESDGVYPFQCYLHPGMTGAVIVGDGGPSKGAIAVAPVELPSPSPQVVISPSPVLRTSIRTVERSSAWPWAVAGVAGLALGAIGGAASARRRSRSAA
jgi:plastocyanin